MMWWGNGWGGGYGGWGGGWGLFALMHILWWVLIILGFVGLVRWAAGSGGRNRHSALDNALHILHERYARGEISREEYEERKRVLKS